MFMGSYKNSIDAKSRMIIPSKYRDALGLKCVVTKGMDRCLYIYPVDEWDNFAAKLATLPKADANARNFVRHFYADAEECEIDRQGRITISQTLRDYAGIQKELSTMGTGEKIEVWARDVWENDENAVDMDGAAIAEGMEKYGI